VTQNANLLIKTQTQHFGSLLRLQFGAELDGFDLVYETYGSLNAAASNAILICHALSANHHAAGYETAESTKPGWWDICIGPGKVIDTDKFFVVCSNNLGGCHGSTGPRSTNPDTKQHYGAEFPVVTVKDWVCSQKLLAEGLGISCWAAVIGGSLGGMQAMQWTIDYPEQVRHACLIASAPKLSAQNIAFNEIARQAILSDPDYLEGTYAEADVSPERGLRLARMLGHVTYQSDDGMREKFGRELKSGDIRQGQNVEFQVESYLRYQGSSFSKSFDANTYILMTRALDYFDPASEFDDDLVAALAGTHAKFFVTSFTSDWRFSPQRSKEIVDALVTAKKNVVSALIETPFGHDAFLLPIERYLQTFGTYMRTIEI
jgi:homoserine O-acetyltransferase